MIQRDDILSMEYLKKSEYTGCCSGMRYRLEKAKVEEDTKLKVTVWPGPFNYVSTSEEEKIMEYFSFDEDGVVDAISWMNDRLFEDKEKWEQSDGKWSAR